MFLKSANCWTGGWGVRGNEQRIWLEVGGWAQCTGGQWGTPGVITDISETSPCTQLPRIFRSKFYTLFFRFILVLHAPSNLYFLNLS